MGRVALCQHQNAQIRQDQRIHPHLVQRGEIRRQMRHFIIPGQRVDGHIDLHAPGVTVLHGFCHFIGCKITGCGAHTKGLTRQIDRIRTISHGKPQLFHITGWSQNLRAFP